MESRTKLCDCAVCGGPVFARKYQAPTVRTCSPACAKTLAVREHPDIETRSYHWKHRVNAIEADLAAGEKETKA